MRKKMTKKKLIDLLAYMTILIHNNIDIEDILSEDETDYLAKQLMDSFDSNEELAMDYLKEQVKKLASDLKLDKVLEDKNE